MSPQRADSPRMAASACPSRSMNAAWIAAVERIPLLNISRWTASANESRYSALAMSR